MDPPAANTPDSAPASPARAWPRGLPAAVAPVLALALVACIYWPVHSGGFYWDDIINFVQNNAWLTQGDEWKHYLLRDFNGWVNYFRPLVVGLYTLQLRLFDSQPGPMHLASLALHLIDSLLVGLLARSCSRAAQDEPRTQPLWFAGTILLYGLHPVLIEDVAWIGCQFDLVATLFMLLGLLASSAVQQTRWRVPAVAACYFLAATAKESAAVFPALLLVFDWALQARMRAEVPLREFTRAFVRRNTPVIAGLFVAGLGYLAFRHWGLGYLVKPEAHFDDDASLPLLGTLQRSAYAYWQYWRMLFWPTHGMNPFHDIVADHFRHASPALLSGVFASAVAVPMALYAAIGRRSALACIALAVTLSVLTVIKLAPVDFTPSLYHERYAINALALACAMLPLLAWPPRAKQANRLARVTVVALAVAWLLGSALTVRSILPLWRTNETAWRWAYTGNPETLLVRENLVAALILDGRLDEAAALTDAFFRENNQCAKCAIDVANEEVNRGDLERADRMIELARTSPKTGKYLDSYLVAAAKLAMAKGEYADAVELLGENARINPRDLTTQLLLAQALEKSGRHAEALAAARMAVAIAPEEKRLAVLQWAQSLAAPTTP